MSTDVFLLRTQKGRYFFMEEKSKYFVVKQKAVPEVLLKVVEAKKLLESAAVLFISTRMISFRSMITRRERPSHS